MTLLDLRKYIIRLSSAVSSSPSPTPYDAAQERRYAVGVGESREPSESKGDVTAIVLKDDGSEDWMKY
jgi:hypothetical protein